MIEDQYSEPHKVTKPHDYAFIVMDGRANYDTDKAMVLEAMGDEVNYERIWYKFKKEWKDTDAVLVCYSLQENGSYADPIIISDKQDLNLL